MSSTFAGLDEAEELDHRQQRLGPVKDEAKKDLDARLEEHTADLLEKAKQKKKERKNKVDAEDPPQISKWGQLFDPREKGAGQMFVLVGKSERGKTHFLRWLLYRGCLRAKDPYQFGLIFVRTKFKHSYKFHWAGEDHVKIYEGFFFLLNVLKQYVANLEERYKLRGYLEPSFVVFDDLVGVLNNDNAWFNNFIGTYRHFNITVFIAVQYLTGRQAISPIMREQTTASIMFNSKTLRTNMNLFENYGQLFPNKVEFMKHFFKCTDREHVGTRHAACVYFEWEDDITRNYMSWLAPKELPDGEVVLRGPDPPLESEEEKNGRDSQDIHAQPPPHYENLPPELRKLMQLQQAIKRNMRRNKRIRVKVEELDALRNPDDLVPLPKTATNVATGSAGKGKWRQREGVRLYGRPTYSEGQGVHFAKKGRYDEESSEYVRF